MTTLSEGSDTRSGGTSYLLLDLKRNRGWPWPESSWGLTPMYGESGWCHSCGIPKGPQIGSLVLQKRGPRVEGGAWIPNWRFDSVCLEGALGSNLVDKFDLELRDIEWHPKDPGRQASQLLIPMTHEKWFAEADLEKVISSRHWNGSGKRCSECGTWRWFPMPFDSLPAIRYEFAGETRPIVASREWFGDGWQAFRLIAVRIDLATALTASARKGLSTVAFNY